MKKLLDQFASTTDRRLLLKECLKFFIPLALLGAAAMLYLYHFGADAERARKLSSDSHTVELARQSMATQLAAVVPDMFFLADQPANISCLSLRTPTSCAAVERLYQIFAKHNLGYSQIRLIDPSGREVVRIQGNGDQTVTSAAQLQNKQGRDYVREGLSRRRGEIYVSPFDLNVEHGVIEQPLNPTIRFVMPLFGERGTRQGLLVLNMRGESALKRLAAFDTTDGAFVYLVNAEGFWLRGPRLEDAWGFMLPERRDRSLARAYPQVWDAMRKSPEQGQLIVAGDQFTYQALMPETILSTPGQSTVQKDRSGAERWFAVVHRPAHAVVTESNNLAWTLGFTYVGLLIVFAMGSAAICHFRLRRRMAENAVFKYAGALEKRADELSASQKQFRLLLDSSSEGILGLDREGRITFCNPSACAMLLYETEALIGQLAETILFQSASNEATEFSLSNTYRDGRSAHISNGILWRQDGEPVSVECTVTPIIKDRQVDGAVMMFKDITARLLDERKLMASERRFQSLVNSAPDAIVVIDEQGRIAMVNQRTETLFGYAREDLLGQAIEVLLPERMRMRHPALRNGYVRDAESRSMGGGRELAALRKDGTEFPVEVSLSPIQTDEGQLVAAALRDISQRKREEAELREAKQAAEIAAHVKSDFLANMSHEIRTPMNAVLGLTYLALKTELTPKQRDYLQKISQSGELLVGIINDILDFSKIEAGKLDVETIDFDLDAVLQHVATLIREKAAAKGLEFVFDVDPAIPHALLGDPLRIGQILINFANNAVKFTEQGHIVLRVERIDIAEEAVVLRFEIEDSGVGIAPEALARLFQAFAQADSSTSRKYGGTGLGLAICKRLAQLMGGDVGVTSALGQGSTFWFTVRLGKGAVISPQLPAHLHGRRLLLVESNTVTCTALGQLLRAMSFRVDEAPSASAALSLASEADIENDPFEIVFIGREQSNISALALHARLKDLILARIPHTVLFTAEDMYLSNGARGTGFDAVLSKPFTASLVLDAVMDAFGEARSTPLPAHDSTTAVPNLAGAHILVVEDNHFNQQVARELLEQAGATVTLADNGREALARVAEQAFDCVMMDMQMPIMDGLEATRRMRADAALSKLPIIAMTANAMREDQEKCRAIGMDDVVTKPIDPARLYSVLVKYLRVTATRNTTPRLSQTPVTVQLSDEGRIIDMYRLDQIVNGDKVALQQLAQTFLRGLHDDITEIEKAMQANDWARIGFYGHRLKSAARTLGADEFADLCCVLEKTNKDSDLAQMRSIVPRLRLIMEQIVREMETSFS